MDKERILEERHEYLTRIRDSLLEDLIVCELREPESDEEPEILTVVLDGIGEAGELEGGVGEFFFAPLRNAEDTVMHFCAVLTLMDALKKEQLPELFEAMSYINFKMPLGSYSVDRDASLLCYRLVVPLPAGLSGEELLTQINIIMANAFTAVSLYADTLIKMAGGEMTLTEALTELG